ncbi:hypothetical protein [Actinocorallia longicatena]|uniref:Uncharacterized protein n=1 Tax=Actinocorallia longicatena TaxID=111803 RepID=A0ABP6QNX5_9ACTN
MGRFRRSGVVVVAGAVLLCGCAANGDEVEERSFTDSYGRACAYVLVKDRDQDDGEDSSVDLDARNVDCDYPPSPKVSERP